MKSNAPLARLGVFALTCWVFAAPWGDERRFGDRAALRADEPLLFGPIPLAVGPDCPTDPPPPVLKVKVRVPACAAVGQPIAYRICVENCSAAEAHHVVLKNALPANAEYVRADPEPTRFLPELQWHLGTVGGGACREVVLVLRPTNAEDVKNCPRVQFEHGQCVTTRLAGLAPGLPGAAVPPVKQPAETKEPPQVPLADRPKLTVTIEGHQRQYVNLNSHYFITVSNTGKTKAGNLLVSCALPKETKFVRADQNWKYAQGQVAWLLGDLEPGAQRRVELVVKALVEGRFCMRATARADLGATAASEGCTQFLGVSALHVELADRDDPLVVGGKTSYPILVRNPGSAAVTNVRLKALVPPALQMLDATGPSKFQVGDKVALGQWVEMGPLAKLAPMTSQTYEIFVEAKRAGATRLHVEVSADQLERGPVTEDESTTLFDDDLPLKIKAMSQAKR
jgi:uncharacterized repeat protein (TIGR01451 family)